MADRFVRGTLVDLRPSAGRRADAADGRTWGEDRCIEAALLEELLTVPVGGLGWTSRPLRLAGARITGSLDLEAAVLTRPLHLEDCFLDERVTLVDAQAVTIRLTGCHLPGLDGQALRTRGDLRLDDGFVASGNVNLMGAQIGGTLNCDRATFTGEDGVALNADLAVVEGSMWLGRARLDGELILQGARIGGSLSCGGSTFVNAAGPSIRADGLHVGRQVFWDGLAVTAACRDGAVRLWNAQIGGPLNLVGATLTNSVGPALNADNLHVERDLFLQQVTANGTGEAGAVRLVGARIGGEVDATGAKVANPSGPALHADQLRVGDGLYLWRGFLATGGIRLREAQTGVLAVDVASAEDTAGRPGTWSIDGLMYSGLPVGATVDEWLDVIARRTPTYAAQPYQQLAGAARAAGDDIAYRKILIAQRRDQLDRRALRGGPQRAWAKVTGFTLGYGYQPWRALLLLLFVVAIAVGLTTFAGSRGGLEHTAGSATSCTAIERIGLGLDLSLPLIKTSAAETCATTATPAGNVITVGGWILQAAAWALATLFVAGFTGAVRKSG